MPMMLKCCKHILHSLDTVKSQDDVNKLKDWSGGWLLNLNIEKCQVLSYDWNVNNEGNYYILLDGVQYPLDKPELVNDLGAIFDSQLRFDKHIDSKINKAYSVFGGI